MPRTYHSSAVLLPDGRVFTGGGGLCGDCGVNHLNAEMFNPPYLFTADGSRAARPHVVLPVRIVPLGATFDVFSSDDSPIASVAIVRYSAATHSTNTDQRRIGLCGFFTEACAGSRLSLRLPDDPGIAPPGNWMLFSFNGAGVPSVSRHLRITRK